MTDQTQALAALLWDALVVEGLIIPAKSSQSFGMADQEFIEKRQKPIAARIAARLTAAGVHVGDEGLREAAEEVLTAQYGDERLAALEGLRDAMERHDRAALAPKEAKP